MVTPPGRSVPANRWDVLDGVWPDEPPMVSVVIVHYEQPGELARTLAALARQTHPQERMEVLVADDGSEVPPEVPDGVTLLRQEDRGNRTAAARNLGASHARGDVLCFLDADTVPEPDYVRQLTRLPALAPEAICVGLRRHADLAPLPVDAPVETAAPAVELPAPAWLAEGYVRTRDLLDSDDRAYRYVISAVLACSRWFWEEAGGFDAHFTSYGGEDWAWAARGWLAGGVLAHVPAAVAWHDGPEWTARAEARPEVKADEALRLARAITVPDARPRGLRTAIADVVVTLADAPSPAAAFVGVDAVLAEVPEAAVVVPERFAALFDEDQRVVTTSPSSARVLVALDAPLRPEGALRRAVDRLGREQLGSLTLTDADDAPLAVVRAGRAVHRVRRWGRADGFADAREPAPEARRVPDHPDIEGWLGGWA